MTAVPLPDLLHLASPDDLEDLFEGEGLETFRRVVTRWGKNEAPHLLQTWWEECRLSPGDLKEALGLSWTMAEWPQQALGAWYWIRLFKEAGFVTDSRALDRPTGSILVYRGASSGRERGMSWTTSLPRARWFARRFVLSEGPSLVLEAKVPAHHVLARFAGRGEEEIVINLHWLTRARYRVLEKLETDHDVPILV